MKQLSSYSSIVKAAEVVSILGHPLLILSLTTVLISFHFYDRANAALISAVILGLVILPVTVNNILKARKKVYTNFDVSDRRQRESFYRFGLGVLTVGTLVLYFIPGAQSFFVGTLFALLMMAASALVNFKVKASLHTGVMVYIAIICFNLSGWITVGLLFFAVLVAISRIILKRHSTPEVLTGALLGIVFGLLHQLYNYVF